MIEDKPASTNPAQRLLDLLIRMKATNGGNTKRNVIAATFGVEASDMVAVVRALSDIYALIDETKVAIRAVGLKQDLYLRAFPKIETALQPHGMDGQWSTSSALLDETVMAMVEVASDLLVTHAKERKMPLDEMAQLLAEIDRVFAEVGEGNLPTSLKRVMLDHLTSMRYAVAHYQIRGAKGLHQALTSTIGDMVMNHGLFKESEGSASVTKFNALVRHLMEWVPFTNSVIELGTGAISLVLPAPV